MVVETYTVPILRYEVQKKVIEFFPKKYSRYLQSGGVIGTSFMYDASKLNREEMQLVYPRNELYLEDPEEQIKYIQGRTKIELTLEQKALYYNLRWIPSSCPMVINPPKSERVEKVIEYKHPSELDEIGLLAQVFKFTEDINREFLLRKYCQIYKSFPRYEGID